jgi:putative membrane protein
MVDDHSKANDELKSLAQQKGVTLPTEMGSEGQALKARLEKLSGDQLDKAYMQNMVKDHTKDVSEFKQASTTAHDSDLKTWAGKTLPTLQDHLKQAKQIAAKEGGTKATTAEQ